VNKNMAGVVRALDQSLKEMCVRISQIPTLFTAPL
jgi:hypothetical protein